MGSGQLGKHLKCVVVSFSLTHSHSKKIIWAQKIEKMVQKMANIEGWYWPILGQYLTFFLQIFGSWANFDYTKNRFWYNGTILEGKSWQFHLLIFWTIFQFFGLKLIFLSAREEVKSLQQNILDAFLVGHYPYL